MPVGKLIYSMSVSLDALVETPSRSLDWVLVDEELQSLFNRGALSPVRERRPGWMKA
jgi:hypothetical protein